MTARENAAAMLGVWIGLSALGWKGAWWLASQHARRGTLRRYRPELHPAPPWTVRPFRAPGRPFDWETDL